jgi:hypothetical protein
MGGVPPTINVGNFPISQPPASSPTTQTGINALPHPTVGTTPCATCHTGGVGGTKAIGYDHASTLINSNCSSCHEAGSNLVGTVWNGATTEATGAGDTRPYTTTVKACEGCVSGSTTENAPNHFYPVDCHECHKAPTGIATVTTGPAYIGNGTPSGATCQVTTMACSNTAPVVACPSGQSCRSGFCQVNCPNNQFCVSGNVCDYPSAWWFMHSTKSMTNPTTCVMCHTNGIPN